MKHNQHTQQQVINSIESFVQTIAQDKIAMATNILRDKIYTDKLKAAITETVCNAVDEHRKYNIRRPVDVIVTESELIVRDYACGLSPEDVKRIFFQYFESTKSTSNDPIGGFGIGAKAPGAYNDLFLVESFYNGKRRVYASTGDQVSVVFETTVPPDNTGIAVRIPIKSMEDKKEFENLARDLYFQIGFDKEQPEIDVAYAFHPIDYTDWMKEMTPEYRYSCYCAFLSPRMKTSNKATIYDGIGVVLENEYWSYSNNTFKSKFWKGHNVYAYDGDIAYKLNVHYTVLEKYGIAKAGYTYLLFFKRGELPVAASRENIENTPFVERWVENRFEALQNAAQEAVKTQFEEYYPTDHTCAELKSSLIAAPFAKLDTFQWPTDKLYTFVDSARTITDNEKVPNRVLRLRPSADAWSVPTMFSLAGNVIFIDCDSKKKINMDTAIDLLKAVVTEDKLFGPNNYKRHICFINTKEKREAFERLRSHFTFLGKEILRDKVDVFQLSDLIRECGYEETNQKKKTTNKKTSVTQLTEYTNGDILEVSDYKKTIVFTADDYKENLNHIRELVQLSKYELHRRSLVQVGVEYFAKVSKTQKDFFVECGCIPVEAFNFKEKALSYLNKERISWSNPSVQVFLKTLDISEETIHFCFTPEVEYRNPWVRITSIVFGEDFRLECQACIRKNLNDALETLSDYELVLVHDAVQLKLAKDVIFPVTCQIRVDKEKEHDTLTDKARIIMTDLLRRLTFKQTF